MADSRIARYLDLDPKPAFKPYPLKYAATPEGEEEWNRKHNAEWLAWHRRHPDR